MRKITLVLFCFLTLTGWSQISTYRYHELQDLGPNIEWAISIECTHHFTPLHVMDVNLKQNFKLEVGRIYKVDLGSDYGNLGERYYKVTYAHDTGVDKGYEIDSPPDFGLPITDLCNSLSWKYARPILLGSTLQEAQDNFCSGLTVNTIREKVNIKTTTPLIKGNVYFMDFGKGANYYLIDGSDFEKGDSNYDLDPTNSNSIFSQITINCPEPDLQAYSFGFTNSINAGQAYTASYRINNLGGRTFNSSNSLFYLSKNDSNLSTDDILLKSETIQTFDANESKLGFPSLTIPSNTVVGNYYIIMKVSNSEETNTTNNLTASSPFTVNSATPVNINKPDLIIDESNTTTISSGTNYTQAINTKATQYLYLGEFLQINLYIKNIGQIASNSMKVGFYITTNSQFSNAHLLKELNFSEIINPNSNKFHSTQITGSSINSYTDAYGKAYIHIVVDYKNNIDEGSNGENNNIFSSIPVISSYNLRTNKLTVNQIKNENLTIQSEPEKVNSTEPYSVDIYNFKGQKIKTEKVKTLIEENKLLEPLEEGFYIIKSNDKTKKIYIK